MYKKWQTSRLLFGWFCCKTVFVSTVSGQSAMASGSGQFLSAQNIFKWVKELESKHVFIKDLTDVEQKLWHLIKGGKNKLQILADFDWTITKSYMDGRYVYHTFEIFGMCPALCDKYRSETVNLANRYEPLTTDPAYTIEEKVKVLQEWWEKHEDLIRGRNMTDKDIEKAVKLANVPLRDNCDVLFDKCCENAIPVVVISAGVGDIIALMLKKWIKDISIASNFLKFEGHKLLGFKTPVISVFNKNTVTIEHSNDRPNVILVGDSLADINMADGFSKVETLLKIGFLSRKNDQLGLYLDGYDIVLHEDQTMNVIIAILDSIIKSDDKLS